MFLSTQKVVLHTAGQQQRLGLDRLKPAQITAMALLTIELGLLKWSDSANKQKMVLSGKTLICPDVDLVQVHYNFVKLLR